MNGLVGGWDRINFFRARWHPLSWPSSTFTCWPASSSRSWRRWKSRWWRGRCANPSLAFRTSATRRMCRRLFVLWCRNCRSPIETRWPSWSFICKSKWRSCAVGFQVFIFEWTAESPRARSVACRCRLWQKFSLRSSSANRELWWITASRNCRTWRNSNWWATWQSLVAAWSVTDFAFWLADDGEASVHSQRLLELLQQIYGGGRDARLQTKEVRLDVHVQLH